MTSEPWNHLGASQTILRRAWLPSLFLAVCVVFYFAAGGSQRDFSVPVGFYGDSLIPQTLAKTILDHGWWWNNPSLSAPGTYPALAFPANTNVDGAVIWLLSWFVSHPGRLINFAWVTMLALAGCSAAACLGMAGISRRPAWFMGLLYAFSPYALYRQLDHMSLVTYLVPIPAAAALLLASGRIPESRRQRLFLGAGCLLIGFNYVYYAFFAATFFVFAAGIGYFTFRRRELAIAAGAGIALIVAATALNLAPSLYVWARDGRPTTIDKKTPAQSEYYGLKIRQLVSPVRPHSVWPLSVWAEKEVKAEFPLETENVSSRLGVVGSLGFLGLLGAVFVAGRYSGPGAGLLLAGGKLTVAGVMLGTMGGFGSLFALLVSPDIRAWNRLSPFLAFFALAAAGLGCDAAVRFARRKNAAWLGVAAVAGVCAFGLYDQLHALEALNRSHAAVRDEYRELRAVVEKVEGSVPRGSMVLQLPFRPFPSDTGTGGMGPYGHFRPYLVSRTLRWSYPALANEHVQYQARLMNLTTVELLKGAGEDGFAAVLIDRSGYSDNAAAITSEISPLLAPDALIVSGGRYIAFNIRKVDEDALRKAAQPIANCGTAPTYHIDRLVAGSASEPMTVAGWAIDSASGKKAARVEAIAGGRRFIPNYDVARPDVASQFQNPAYGTAGFGLLIPGGTLPPGSHNLRLRLLTNDGKCFQEGAPIPFTLM